MYNKTIAIAAKPLNFLKQKKHPFLLTLILSLFLIGCGKPQEVSKRESELTKLLLNLDTDKINSDHFNSIQYKFKTHINNNDSHKYLKDLHIRLENTFLLISQKIEAAQISRAEKDKCNSLLLSIDHRLKAKSIEFKKNRPGQIWKKIGYSLLVSYTLLLLVNTNLALSLIFVPLIFIKFMIDEAKDPWYR